MEFMEIIKHLPTLAAAEQMLTEAEKKNPGPCWRVVPGSAPTVYASGLTNVTGLAFAGRTLYAVEFSSAGLLTVPEGEVPTGSLLRITPGASRHTVIAGGLTAPYGVAIRGGSAYVTTCGLCAWIGGVVKIGR